MKANHQEVTQKSTPSTGIPVLQAALHPNSTGRLLVDVGILLKHLLWGTYCKETFSTKPLTFIFFKRSKRQTGTLAPVDCRLGPWSGWTECFSCEGKKVRLHINVFIFDICLQMYLVLDEHGSFTKLTKP